MSPNRRFLARSRALQFRYRRTDASPVETGEQFHYPLDVALAAVVARLTSRRLIAQTCNGGDKPSLVVLDLMLPGLSGLEVMEELRGDTATSNIAVLMLTGPASASTVKVVSQLRAEKAAIQESTCSIRRKIKRRMRGTGARDSGNEEWEARVGGYILSGLIGH